MTDLGQGMTIEGDVIVGYPQAEPLVPHAASPCLFCGKKTSGELLVRMVGGGGQLALRHDDPQFDGDPGDMYYFPVGSVCAKALPASAVAAGG